MNQTETKETLWNTETPKQGARHIQNCCIYATRMRLWYVPHGLAMKTKPGIPSKYFPFSRARLSIFITVLDKVSPLQLS